MLVLRTAACLPSPRRPPPAAPPFLPPPPRAAQAAGGERAGAAACLSGGGRHSGAAGSFRCRGGAGEQGLQGCRAGGTGATRALEGHLASTGLSLALHADRRAASSAAQWLRCSFDLSVLRCLLPHSLLDSPRGTAAALRPRFPGHASVRSGAALCCPVLPSR